MMTDNLSYQSISAFDLDHTLLTVNASFLYGKFLYSKGLLSKWDLPFIIGGYIFHKLGFLSLESLHQFSLNKIFSKKKRLDLKTLESEFVEIVKAHLYPPAVAELRKAYLNQHYVILLSSSPNFIVEPLADYFKIENWDSTCYLVDKDEFFFKINYVMDGERKAQSLRILKEKLKIKTTDTSVFTDSILDLPFLFEAGYPVAVNPDKKLRKLSLQYQWKII